MAIGRMYREDYARVFEGTDHVLCCGSSQQEARTELGGQLCISSNRAISLPVLSLPFASGAGIRGVDRAAVHDAGRRLLHRQIEW